MIFSVQVLCCVDEVAQNSSRKAECRKGSDYGVRHAASPKGRLHGFVNSKLELIESKIEDIVIAARYWRLRFS